MARGKKTEYSDIVKIFVSYAGTGNYTETAKQLGFPPNTVKGIINKNKGKKEFAKLLNKNKEEFAKVADEIVGKAMRLLNRRFDRALNKEEELDLLIDEIDSDGEMNENLKFKLIQKVRELQIQSASEIAKTMGIVYDKKALAKGELTENVRIEIGIDEE